MPDDFRCVLRKQVLCDARYTLDVRYILTILVEEADADTLVCSTPAAELHQKYAAEDLDFHQALNDALETPYVTATPEGLKLHAPGDSVDALRGGAR